MLRTRVTNTHKVSALRVTLTRIAPRELDSDNLASAFKAVRDGVADALERDDGDPGIDWLYAQRKGKAYAITIRLEGRAS